MHLEATLRCMEGRKFLRRFKGAYHKNRPLLAWAFFLLMMFFWTMDDWRIQNNEVRRGGEGRGGGSDLCKKGGDRQGNGTRGDNGVFRARRDRCKGLWAGVARKGGGDTR